ncbi:MAG: hypothetical protein EBU31_08830, partial [Proteobacteria bacterium]|nr:hypothetical protein [Pseudomonadota bacterium]
STLSLIAVGLAIFMIFSAGMTWLRQYLVLHTGNRVDAVLGSHVFWHLLRLPMPYFEHRPTGTLVARLHAVETIRSIAVSWQRSGLRFSHAGQRALGSSHWTTALLVASTLPATAVRKADRLSPSANAGPE